MEKREQLLQEISTSSDEQIETVFNFLKQLESTTNNENLLKLSGILSDSDAQEILETIKSDYRQVDANEW